MSNFRASTEVDLRFIVLMLLRGRFPTCFTRLARANHFSHPSIRPRPANTCLSLATKRLSFLASIVFVILTLHRYSRSHKTRSYFDLSFWYLESDHVTVFNTAAQTSTICKAPFKNSTISQPIWHPKFSHVFLIQYPAQSSFAVTTVAVASLSPSTCQWDIFTSFNLVRKHSSPATKRNWANLVSHSFSSCPARFSSTLKSLIQSYGHPLTLFCTATTSNRVLWAVPCWSNKARITFTLSRLCLSCLKPTYRRDFGFEIHSINFNILIKFTFHLLLN